MGLAAVSRQARPTASVAPEEPLRPAPAQRECVYYTSMGKRTLLAVNGVCPLQYGQ